MATTNTAPKLLKVIDALDLHKLPPAQLLGNSHLEARGLNIVYGASGTYKSFYALDVALQIAQTSSVLYVAGEGANGLDVRVKAWCDYHKLTPGHLKFYCQEIDLMNADAVLSLIDTVKTFQVRPALIILDTYARCLPNGDENSTRDTGKAVQNCARIQRTLSTAVLLVHHENKAGTGERGAVALRGAADVMIKISARDDSVRVDCAKVKNWAEWPREFLRFQSHGDSGLLLPASQVAAPSSKLGQREIDLLSFLSLSIFSVYGARTNQISDGTGIKGGGLYRMLARLKNAGVVKQAKRGDPYSITPQGSDELKAALSASGAPMPDPAQGFNPGVVEDDDLNIIVN